MYKTALTQCYRYYNYNRYSRALCFTEARAMDINKMLFYLWLWTLSRRFSLWLRIRSIFSYSRTERSIYYRKYILQITQPSLYRYTQLQYRFAVISEASSTQWCCFHSCTEHGYTRRICRVFGIVGLIMLIQLHGLEGKRVLCMGYLGNIVNYICKIWLQMP